MHHCITRYIEMHSKLTWLIICKEEQEIQLFKDFFFKNAAKKKKRATEKPGRLGAVQSDSSQ